MAKKKKSSPQEATEPTPDGIHPAFQLRHTLRGHEAEVYRMALSPDGRMLASPSDEKTVRLWDVESGQLLKTLKGHSVGVICAAWSPDGRTLASGDNQNVIHLWNVETGETLRIFEGHC